MRAPADDYALPNPYPTLQGGANVPGFGALNLGRSQLANIGDDIAPAKSVKLAESRALQVRLETFNTFNHAQFFGPTSVNGEITGWSTDVASSGELRFILRRVSGRSHWSDRGTWYGHASRDRRPSAGARIRSPDGVLESGNTPRYCSRA